MPKKSSLREYHVLVTRSAGGFLWEIRYNRHARPVLTSQHAYRSHEDAEWQGLKALAAFKATFLPEGSAGSLNS